MDTYANTYLIPLLILMPLFGAIGITRLPKGNDRQVRDTALVFSCFAFLLSLAILYAFDFQHSGKMQFVAYLPWVDEFGLSFQFGVDAISLWLIMLTTFLMPIVILSSFNAVKERVREFYMWLLFLETAMLGVFFAMDILFFYICFEFTLIPLFFLIGIYGSSERLKAARVFFLYTFTGSMMTFAGLLYVAWAYASSHGVWNFNIQTLVNFAGEGLTMREQFWVLLAMLSGFAVKVPIFPVHTWLPLAHTEAPTAGSVVLAGVLLKLGTYALLRLAIPMTPLATLLLSPYIAFMATVGIIYTALICWVQKDIKRLVAYSSVSHLGFCVLGMFALNLSGISGSVIYMINHGLSTGALFILIGMIYERFHTREMAQLQGLARVLPIWSSFMVFFCLASVGLPGLNGFVGEFLTLMGAFTSPHLGPTFAFFAGTGLILGAIYILYMIGKVVFGAVKLPDDYDPSHPVSDLNLREIIVLTPLAIACLWLGLYPNCILTTLDAPAAKIIAKVDMGSSLQRFPSYPNFVLSQTSPVISHNTLQSVADKKMDVMP